MSPPTQKPPANRKLAYMALAAVGLIGVLGVIAVMQEDPRAKREAEAAAEEAERIAALPVGTEEQAAEQLDEIARQAERERQRAEEARRAFDEFTGTDTATGLPAFDDTLLRQLDAAQRQVARRPDVNTLTANTLPLPGSGARSASGGGGSQILYDNYDAKPVPAEDKRASQDLFDGPGNSTNRGGAGIYETIKPQSAPSARVINQGVMIPAVLMTRIDTRNAGPIKAMVTRTVYDSRTHQIELIPQGSKLVGSYSTSVAPGVDRIPVVFERLILPNGDAFRLPSFPTSGLDGTIGVEGDYHSNILQAIGPAFVVAVLGQAVDRQVAKSIPNEGRPVGPGKLGGAFESPSVLQQTVPKINEAVMQRYQGAKPYFTADLGQSIRVVLTQDLEVPAGGA